MGILMTFTRAAKTFHISAAELLNERCIIVSNVNVMQRFTQR